MRHIKYANVSIWLSVISIVFTLIINVKIGYDYLHAYGKEKALFGLHELFIFWYQYYVVVLGILAFSVAAVSFVLSKYKLNHSNIIAFLLSFIAIAIVFLRAWRIILLTN